MLACATAVAALAAAMRIPGAVRDALWQDELASVHVLIQPTPWAMVHQIARTEATPPLWYAVGWLANQLGLSPQGFRAFSVIAGAALAGVTLLLARRLLPLWASVAAAILVACGWQFVMHGRELRAYELFALTVVVFAYVLLEEREAGPVTGWRRHRLAVAVACGSLTNYFFVLSVLAALIWLWSDGAHRDVRPRITRQVAIGLVPLLIWSPILVHQYLGQRFSWIGPFSIRGLIDSYWELFTNNVQSSVLLPLLVLAAVLTGCWLLARASAEGRLVGLLATVPVAIVALAWIGGAHVFDPRNLIGAGPFAAIALAGLPARLPRAAGYPVAATAAVAITIAAASAEATPPTPYDKVANLLVSEGWKPSDPILLFGGFGDFFAYRSPLEWYLPGQPVLTLGEAQPARTCGAIFVVTPSGRVGADVLRSGHVDRYASVGHVLVARLTFRHVPREGLWAYGHLFAVRDQRHACVRLVAEARIITELQR